MRHGLKSMFALPGRKAIVALANDARLRIDIPGIGRLTNLPEHRPLVATPAAARQLLRITRSQHRSHFASSLPGATHATEATSATFHTLHS
eukprot:8106419-Pyramimonas_sp.AAC.1